LKIVISKLLAKSQKETALQANLATKKAVIKALVAQVIQYIEFSERSLLLLDWFESRKVGGTVR